MSRPPKAAPSGRRLLPTKAPGQTWTAARERLVIELCEKLRAEPIPKAEIAARPLPTLLRLQEVFTLDGEAGVLLARRNCGQMVRGRPTGTLSTSGYRLVFVDYVQYKSHRIIWKMAHGRDPKGCIDHINGERDDNRPSNLRDVLPVENSRNRHKSTSNSGVLGVSWCRSSKRWQATIGFNNRNISLGSYIKKTCAVAARQCAERHLYNLDEVRAA
ncbi:MAG: HNH endonuclease signature motif containing protein [Pseudomonadota bacterium]